MKLRITLIIQPVGKNDPSVSQSGVIDSSMGILSIGGALSQLLATCWEQFRAKEPSFKQASEP